MKTNLHSKKAFTLIELLVVIAIIGILVGLLLPALRGAREQAKKMKAQAAAQAVAMALKGYYNEYGTWPCKDNGSSRGGGTNGQLSAQELNYIFKILSGQNINLQGSTSPSVGGNPRRIVFLDVKKREVKPILGTYKQNATKLPPYDLVNDTDLAFVDPWYTAYHIRFDDDGDNATEVFGSNAKINATLAVWSAGLDGKESNAETDGYSPTIIDNQDNICTWK